MHSIARVRNSYQKHQVEMTTGQHSASISIAPKASGFGSSVSGGEMLMAALATCYCNDVYREAAKMNIEVSAVDVECSADFPAEGAPASAVTCTARISARASADQIRELAARTDRLAEIHNTVRSAIPVALGQVEVQSA
jgi:uncharacterized OsmC-like protein